MLYRNKRDERVALIENLSLDRDGEPLTATSS